MADLHSDKYSYYRLTDEVPTGKYGAFMKSQANSTIESLRVPAPVKLSLLWASLMSLYIYNDYFVLFVPGTLDLMAAGSLGPLGPVTDLKMIAVAAILAIPASMIFLSSTLPSNASRRLNMIVGPIYTLIAVLTLYGSPPFYKMIVLIEIIATILIFRIALHWPKQSD